MALQLGEVPASSRTRMRALDLFQGWLEHPRFPAMLALGAVLVMLPALKLGLIMDDLPQRMVALPPDQVPARLHDLGLPLNSGSCSTVVRNFFFGYYRDPQRAALARNYGLLPWWTPDSLKIGLWRPVTAFTHWLDYRLYPDSPALMHARLHPVALPRPALPFSAPPMARRQAPLRVDRVRAVSGACRLRQ